MNVDRQIALIPTMSAAGRTRLRANAEKYLAGTEPERIAAGKVIAALDAHTVAENQALVDKVQGMARPARVAGAFSAMPPTGTEERVIRVLLDHPGSTSTTLSAAMGWLDKTWQMHFGIMCQKREHLLWPVANDEKRDEPVWSGILADLEPDAAGHWRFTMKPDAVAGLDALGIRAGKPK